MDKLNLNKLHSTNKKLEDFRIKTYEQVKKQCYNRIDIVSKAPKNFCWFSIPTLIVGYPPINVIECAEYLKKKLDSEPVVYEYYYPSLFYITWDLQMLKNKELLNLHN